MNVLKINTSAWDKQDPRLTEFRKITKTWRNLFDRRPPMPLEFTVNSQDELLLDGIVIDSLSRISACNADICPDYICLSSSVRPDYYYRIRIVWTNTDDMYVSEIALVLHRHIA